MQSKSEGDEIRPLQEEISRPDLNVSRNDVPRLRVAMLPHIQTLV
jgi:hypothetical protein